MRQDLKSRLATLNITIGDEIARQHLDAISDELRKPQPLQRPARRRVRIAALATAAVLVALPATALAAEAAVPGDLLYPVKRAVEFVLSVVDPNLEAEHRIEELEAVIERDAPAVEIESRLSAAEDAVRDRDIPVGLTDRLNAARDRVGEGDRDLETPPEPGEADTGQRDDEPSDRPTTSGEPDETPTTTSAPPGEADADRIATTTAPPETDRPPRDTTTTTAPPRDGDRPPRDGG